MSLAILLIVGLVLYLWLWAPLRLREPGFLYVYVNQDGSARELSPEEQAYLSEEFSGADGGRPYIKWSYWSREGWGSRSGYIERRRVPFWVNILPVSPDYDAAVKELDQNWEELSHRAAGDTVIKNPDGSITYLPDPEISTRKRFKILRQWHLEQERRLEELAKL